MMCTSHARPAHACVPTLLRPLTHDPSFPPCEHYEQQSTTCYRTVPQMYQQDLRIINTNTSAVALRACYLLHRNPAVEWVVTCEQPSMHAWLLCLHAPAGSATYSMVAGLCRGPKNRTFNRLPSVGVYMICCEHGGWPRPQCCYC
jgi:hypothetical protein